MMKKTLLFVLLLVGFMSASSPVSDGTPKANAIETNLKYRDLKKMAETAKGEKLTFKEKVGLKLFNKKIKSIKKNTKTNGKGRTVAVLLCAFLGGLGIHRFYLGYTWQGVVQLLTAGGCGIWALIDFIRILTGDLQPKGGSYDPDWK
jgi:TM2 domain-containing membrane protein YozV